VSSLLIGRATSAARRTSKSSVSRTIEKPPLDGGRAHSLPHASHPPERAAPTRRRPWTTPATSRRGIHPNQPPIISSRRARGFLWNICPTHAHHADYSERPEQRNRDARRLVPSGYIACPLNDLCRWNGAILRQFHPHDTPSGVFSAGRKSPAARLADGGIAEAPPILCFAARRAALSVGDRFCFLHRASDHGIRLRR
jgi:hypothetical protein